MVRRPYGKLYKKMKKVLMSTSWHLWGIVQLGGLWNPKYHKRLKMFEQAMRMCLSKGKNKNRGCLGGGK